MDNWIVVAVGKHVVTQQALTRGGIIVRVDKSAEFGVIIAGLQVIETGFGIGALAGRNSGSRKELSSFASIIRHIYPYRKRKRAMESEDSMANVGYRNSYNAIPSFAKTSSVFRPERRQIESICFLPIKENTSWGSSPAF